MAVAPLEAVDAAVVAAPVVVAVEPPAVVAAPAAVVAVVVADPDELELSLPQAAAAITSDAPQNATPTSEAQPMTAFRSSALRAYSANPSSNTHAHFPLCGRHPHSPFREWRCL